MTVEKMLEKLVSLISILILSGNLMAEEAGVNFSGFLYNTTFSDNKFHDNRNIVAVNADIDYYNFAVRTQISNTPDPIRRAVIEYAGPISEKTDFVYQIGRFSRIDSFSNTVLDSPASSQMAILPFAGYSYRMINGDFALMDGHQIQVSGRTPWDHLIRIKGSYGKGVVTEQDDLQKESIKRYDPNILLQSGSSNYDMSIHYETENTHSYIAQNHYQVLVNTNSKLPKYQFITFFNHEVEYIVTRYGFKYDNKKWFARTELILGNTESYSKTGSTTATSKSRDYNIVSGIYLDNYVIYSGYSNGKNLTGGNQNTDHFVGITYNYNSVLTTSVEYHRGRGNSWMKYDSTSDSWNSFVISTTLKF